MQSQPPRPEILSLVAQGGLQSLEALAEAYRGLFARAWQKGSDGGTVLAALSPTGRLEDLAARQTLPSNQARFRPGNLLAPATVACVTRWLPEPIAAQAKASNTSRHSKNPGLEPELRRLQAEREQLERRIPESVFGMIGTDEDPHDVRVNIRGNHKNLGEVAPRRFLQIVAGEKQASVSEGSGRLQLAAALHRRNSPQAQLAAAQPRCPAVDGAVSHCSQRGIRASASKLAQASIHRKSGSKLPQSIAQRRH